MWDIFYPIASVLIGSVLVFMAGFLCASVFLRSRMALAAQKYPRVVRWCSVAIIVITFLVLMKMLRPLYYAVVVGISLALFVWGFLSRIEKRVLCREVLSTGFWFPKETVSHIVKNGM